MKTKPSNNASLEDVWTSTADSECYSDETQSGKNLSQLYEIHVSVSLSTSFEEMRWMWFCKENNYHSIRVLNVGGKYPVQNMIGKWCSRKNPQDATRTALAIADKIHDVGFCVVRTKVEGCLENSQFKGVVLNNDPSFYW